jgi:hypothetical protein
LFYDFALFAPIAVARSDAELAQNDMGLDDSRASKVSDSVLIPATLGFGMSARQAILLSQQRRAAGQF